MRYVFRFVQWLDDTLHKYQCKGRLATWICDKYDDWLWKLKD